MRHLSKRVSFCRCFLGNMCYTERKMSKGKIT
nr:MAG TPA: hypothetical protein [Bacteriophage sp.]